MPEGILIAHRSTASGCAAMHPTAAFAAHRWRSAPVLKSQGAGPKSICRCCQDREAIGALGCLRVARSRGRNPQPGGVVGPISRDYRARDIVAVAGALLDGMARRHPVASKQHAGEEAWRARFSGATTRAPAHYDRNTSWRQAQLADPQRSGACLGNRQDAAGNRRCAQRGSPEPCRRRHCPAQAGWPHRTARREALESVLKDL